jgi:hypothetical protein
MSEAGSTRCALNVWLSGSGSVVRSSSFASRLWTILIRHPQHCRALVLIVSAGYLPEGTAVHSGAFAIAMISSDFFAGADCRSLRSCSAG